MKSRYSVCASSVYLLMRDIGNGTKPGHEVCFCFRQQVFEVAPALKKGRSGFLAGKKISDPVCQIGGKRMMCVSNKIDLSLADEDQGSIHAIKRGTAHESGKQ